MCGLGEPKILGSRDAENRLQIVALWVQRLKGT